MTTSTSREHGRRAFAERAWSEAFDQLSRADEEGVLTPVDLEMLSTAAFLIGKDDASDALAGRAFRALSESGESERAARCAFWLGMRLFDSGELARGGGWLAKGARVVAGRTCVEQGYFELPEARRLLAEGDGAGALEVLGPVDEIAERYGDDDLIALVRLAQGQAKIIAGDTADGLVLLDEAMVAVVGNEVSPAAAGIVYCAVISTCHLSLDLRRAQEWTTALERWCATQPDLVPFRGLCLLHRAQIMQFTGAWTGALVEARAAAEWLSGQGSPVAAAAHYEQGEIHRLRGEYVQAVRHFEIASAAGYEVQPGLALTRLGQGRTQTAAVATRRVMSEAVQPIDRTRLLPAHVEILLAAEEVSDARAASEELTELARHSGVPFLDALAAHCGGSVLLAEGRVDAALASLRGAEKLWAGLGAVYESARTRMCIGVACRTLGDEESARLELVAACQVFEELGAVPDAAGVAKLLGVAAAVPGGLTTRELEVLRGLAAGGTNRAIAKQLTVSEKTVARHVSNIFVKLGVTSRAAATAYAYEHDLLSGSGETR